MGEEGLDRRRLLEEGENVEEGDALLVVYHTWSDKRYDCHSDLARLLGEVGVLFEQATEVRDVGHGVWRQRTSLSIHLSTQPDADDADIAAPVFVLSEQIFPSRYRITRERV